MSLCSIKKIIMMKKTYINPNMKVVKMATRQMMATSLTVSSTEVNGSSALGRDYDFEDEEW